MPLGGSAPPGSRSASAAPSTARCAAAFGESPGALTAAFTDPESGLTVVVALNNSTSGPDFVRETAFALASLGSKATAASERQKPLIELPWSLDQATDKMPALGLCPTVADAPAETPTETPAPPAEG